MPQDPDQRPDDEQDPPSADEPGTGGEAGGASPKGSDGTGSGSGSGYRLGGSGSVGGGGGARPGFGSGGFGAGFGGLGGGAAPSGGGDPANPLEALFASLAGGDTNALAAQLQSAFQMLGGGGFGGPGFGGGGDSSSGVNWEVTKDMARKSAAALGPDPTPSSAQVRAVTDAVGIAEVWLDAATDFPRVAGTATAWSRAEWIERTMPVWRRLVEPVASHIADAMAGALTLGGEDAPEGMPQIAGMAEMLRPMLRSSGASMFGLQLGQGLGQLSGEVVSTTDIGLPLTDTPQVALLPTNVAAFGEGLEQSGSDVTLYLTLRECARQRLFASAGWLRSQLLVLVEQYAAGITIDTSALEEAVSGMDPTNLEELGAKLEGGLFEPHKTPEQLATLQRLETMLALVEGWVDDVVTEATAPWMPAAVPLAETVRRRRATGGPAEATFATLVGLELRPRRLRDAANLWAAVRDARGAEGRDAVWSHPDLVPTSADLDDPLGFARGEAAAQSSGDDDFDAALAELLDEAEHPQDGPDPQQDPDRKDDQDRKDD
ncbi:zinc-dependent metalloprotease [Microlunatus flavus]|uniref:Putative hydrolase n=1 Tax=Microlunatus flavus TaxID=1036181 RepID=A0A1H9I0Z1_9ACTN|nr:zinc-dependent metalloprotease [Microlunatus flavus]SEQ68280.1 putative hydrolase [Microlunatus flavus]